jgi:tRNA G46 methylase TrmB
LTQRNSPQIETSQETTHEDVLELVKRYADSAWLKPLSNRAESLRRELEVFRNRQFILDSGCGTGRSSVELARQYPDHLVLACDQSEVRLEKGIRNFMDNTVKSELNNLVVIRAELTELWRLLDEASLYPEKHYILFPNPWPKPDHLKRRWHGHPIFPLLFKLSPEIEIRSNWDLYVREFALAYEFLGGVGEVMQYIAPEPALTLFEKKYQESGHTLWKFIGFQAITAH